MNMRKITLVLALVLAMLLSVSLAYADGYTAKVSADVEIPVAVDGPIVYVDGDYSAEAPVPFTVEWFAEPAEEDAEPYAVLNMLLMPDSRLKVAEDAELTAVLREVLALQITENDADHQWNSGVELAPANCQTQGIVMAECKDCFAMKFNLMNGSHAYGAWQTVTEPTCTAIGIRKMTCSVCGNTLQKEIDMLDHAPMIDEAVEPTCTETGLTEGRHCDVCGAVLFEQEVIPALGHTEVIDASVAPTCTAAGLTEGKHCSVCNTVLVKQEEIAALGHTEVIDAAVAPTHTETGLTEGCHCAVCGETLAAQEVIPATGYSVFITVKGENFSSVIHEQYAAFTVCAPDGLPIEPKDGYTFVGYRTDAGTLYKVGELIPMDEFTEQNDEFWINLTVAFEKEETEDPDVVYTDIDSYTVCLTIVSPVDNDNSVITETYSFDPEKDTSVGTVSYPSSRQLAVYVRKGLTPIGFRSLITGNVFSIGDAYVLDQLPAAAYAGQTVTDVSETEKQRVSNYEINDKLVPLYSFFGSSGAFLDPLYSCEIAFYVPDPIDDSQNTSAPVTTVGTQTISGITMDELTAYDYYVSLNAAPSYEGYIFNGYGLLTGSFVSIDGNQLVLNDMIADLAGQNGHLYLSLKLYYSIDTRCPGCGANDTAVITEAQEPTCTEPGLTEGKHCSACGTVLVEQEPVDPMGHTVADDDAVAPTCTEPGLTDGKHCSVCNAVLVAQEEISPLGHTEETDSGFAATCTEPGLTDGKRCSVCNAVLVAQEEIAPLDHTEETDPGFAATCTEPGLTDGKHCSVCSAVLVAQEEISPLGHTEETDPGFAATCTEPGLTDGKHCSVCNAVLVAQEEISPLGHTEETDPGYAATCTAVGLTEGKHCSVCNTVLVKQEELPATGHKFASYGMCEVCGYWCPHPHGLTNPGYYSDADHYGYCDVHDGTGIEEHTFEYTSVNDYEHTVSCKHCGYSFNEAHDIDFVPEDGTAFCKICKAEFGW